MIDINKYQLHTHVYSSPLDAKVTSESMGLGPSFHVQQVDGQAYYMPGTTHTDYLTAMGYSEAEEGPVSEDKMVEAIRAVVAEIMNKNDTGEFKILKTDEEQRMIYGWASVSTVKGELLVDKQGDAIEMDTLEKAVNDFMEHVRVGKTMHVGDQTGAVIHSLPISKSLCEALGIHSDMEGWVVGYKVYDDSTWEGVKSGKYASFSIGGKAVKEEYSA